MPEPDLEDQRKAELAERERTADATLKEDDSSASGGDGVTAVDTKLDDFLNSAEYMSAHVENPASIVNPDGTEAIRSTDTEAQDALDKKEVAEELATRGSLAPGLKERLEPGLSNVDISDLLEEAANGDPVAKALAQPLVDEATLVGIEHQVQLGALSPDAARALVGDRMDQAEKDIAAALGGDKDAWIRYQQNVTGTTPTKDDVTAFYTANGLSPFAAESYFQNHGIGTRPQELLDRLNELLGEADKAATGDIDAALALGLGAGISGNALFNPDGTINTSALGTLTSSLKDMADHPAGTAVGIPGKDTVAVDANTPSPFELWTQPDWVREDESGQAGDDSQTRGGDVGKDWASSDDRHGSGDGSYGGGPLSGEVRFGDDGGDSSSGQTNNDPGSGVPDDGGRSNGGSQGAANDEPDTETVGTSGASGGAAGASGASGGAAGASGGASGAEATVVEFGGMTVLGGGGSDNQTEPNNLARRIENPQGGVTYVNPNDGSKALEVDAGGGVHQPSSSSPSTGSVKANPDQVDGGGGHEPKDRGTTGEDDEDAKKGSGSNGQDDADKSSGVDKTVIGTDTSSEESTEYVDNDAGGYSNTTLGGEQAAASLEQHLVRGGGDPVDPDAAGESVAPDRQDSSTQEHVTFDAASTEGGTLSRFPAPKDPVGPDPQEPTDFGGSHDDPSIYSMGTGSTAANESPSGVGAMAVPSAMATGFGSDSPGGGGRGDDGGSSGDGRPRSDAYAATAGSSEDASTGSSASGGYAAAGSGGNIYGVASDSGDDSGSARSTASDVGRADYEFTGERAMGSAGGLGGSGGGGNREDAPAEKASASGGGDMVGEGVMEPGRDPRLDRKEPQLQTQEASKDEASSDGSGDGTATITGDASADLETFVKSDAYHQATIGSGSAAKDPDAEKPDEPAPDDDAGSDLNLGDVGNIFEGAAKGDPTDAALATILTDDVPILSVQRQAGLAGVPDETVNKVLDERIAQAEADAAAGAGGDRDAWIRSQQNLAGITPSDADLANFDKGGGPNILGLERGFQLMGVETRPQEYLDRIAGLQKDLDAARAGDPAAVERVAAATGANPADLSKDLGGPSFDALGSMFAGIAQMPAAPGVGVPGSPTGGGTQGKQDSSATSSGQSSKSSTEVGGGTSSAGGPSGRDPFNTRPGDGEAPNGGSDGGDPTSGQTHDDPGPDSPDDGGGGSDGGDPSSGQTHDDPDPGTPDDQGGGDDGGDPSSGQTNDDPGTGKPEGTGGGGDGYEPPTPKGEVTTGTQGIEVGTYYTKGQDSDHYEYPSGATVDIPHDSGDDDSTEYVDNDAGGYSSTIMTGGLTFAAEQTLVRGGGDPVNPDTVDSSYVLDIPDSSTMEYRSPDAASTEGTGTITRAAAPKDPVRPEDAQEPFVFTGNPNDPSIYSSGSGTAGSSSTAQQAYSAPSGGPTQVGRSDSDAPSGSGGNPSGGGTGGDSPQSSSYAATAEQSGGAPAGPLGPAGQGGYIGSVDSGSSAGPAGPTAAGGYDAKGRPLDPKAAAEKAAAEAADAAAHAPAAGGYDAKGRPLDPKAAAEKAAAEAADAAAHAPAAGGYDAKGRPLDPKAAAEKAAAEAADAAAHAPAAGGYDAKGRPLDPKAAAEKAAAEAADAAAHAPAAGGYDAKGRPLDPKAAAEKAAAEAADAAAHAPAAGGYDAKGRPLDPKAAAERLPPRPPTPQPTPPRPAATTRRAGPSTPRPPPRRLPPRPPTPQPTPPRPPATTRRAGPSTPRPPPRPPTKPPTPRPAPGRRLRREGQAPRPQGRCRGRRRTLPRPRPARPAASTTPRVLPRPPRTLPRPRPARPAASTTPRVLPRPPRTLPRPRPARPAASTTPRVLPRPPRTLPRPRPARPAASTTPRVLPRPPRKLPRPRPARPAASTTPTAKRQVAAAPSQAPACPTTGPMSSTTPTANRSGEAGPSLAQTRPTTGPMFSTTPTANRSGEAGPSQTRPSPTTGPMPTGPQRPELVLRATRPRPTSSARSMRRTRWWTSHSSWPIRSWPRRDRPPRAFPTARAPARPPSCPTRARRVASKLKRRPSPAPHRSRAAPQLLVPAAR